MMLFILKSLMLIIFSLLVLAGMSWIICGFFSAICWAIYISYAILLTFVVVLDRVVDFCKKLILKVT
ncbi:MAG: hypothetical protein IJ859_08865 [Synergistaceae bacterium]|nr:hypothetical protein [Synergistaceae bacterium]